MSKKDFRLGFEGGFLIATLISNLSWLVISLLIH
jgi:hypothetical protein